MRLQGNRMFLSSSGNALYHSCRSPNNSPPTASAGFPSAFHSQKSSEKRGVLQGSRVPVQVRYPEGFEAFLPLSSSDFLRVISMMGCTSVDDGLRPRPNEIQNLKRRPGMISHSSSRSNTTPGASVYAAASSLEFEKCNGDAADLMKQVETLAWKEEHTPLLLPSIFSAHS